MTHIISESVKEIRCIDFMHQLVRLFWAKILTVLNTAQLFTEIWSDVHYHHVRPDIIVKINLSEKYY